MKIKSMPPKRKMSSVVVPPAHRKNWENQKVRFNEEELLEREIEGRNMKVEDWYKQNQTVNQIISNHGLTQSLPQFSHTFNGWRTLYLGICSPFQNKYSKYVDQLVKNPNTSPTRLNSISPNSAFNRK